jgi:DNA-binding CsgD family transcriptional regulator
MGRIRSVANVAKVSFRFSLFIPFITKEVRSLVSPQTLVSVYGAILDDTLWQPALDALSGELNASSALLIHSEVQDNLPFRISLGSKLWAGIPQQQIEFFEHEYGHYEAEAWDYLQRSAAGTIAYDTDFAEAEVLRQRPDYRYTIENFGLCHRFGVRLNDNPAWFDALTFQFSDDFAIAPETGRLLLPELSPHIAKATECGRTFRALRTQYEAALAALDHVAIGLCVVTDRAAIVVKNETFDAILAETPGLKILSGGELVCASKHGAFREAVRRCAKTAAGLDNTKEVLLATDDNSGAGLLLEISPLRDQSGEVDRGLSAALVTVIDPKKTEALDTSKVALAWDLSEAEGEVLAMLVSGDTNAVMAEKRNVSVETIKSQLSSVYSKTSTRKRSDLIRLVTRTSPPIR